jgi:hypothetical protein
MPMQSRIGRLGKKEKCQCRAGSQEEKKPGKNAKEMQENPGRERSVLIPEDFAGDRKTSRAFPSSPLSFPGFLPSWLPALHWHFFFLFGFLM